MAKRKRGKVKRKCRPAKKKKVLSSSAEKGEEKWVSDKIPHQNPETQRKSLVDANRGGGKKKTSN